MGRGIGVVRRDVGRRVSVLLAIALVVPALINPWHAVPAAAARNVTPGLPTAAPPSGPSCITTTLGAGENHYLAIDATDGSVWTWGTNVNGQLGNGTTTDSATPVHVVGAGGTGLLTGIAAVAGGFGYSLATRSSDGTVWAWGYGLDGELGDGNSTSSSAPVQVAGLSGAVAVAAGFGHSLAVDSHGAVWAWGNNRFGEVGNNTTTNAPTPVQVLGPGGSGFLAGIVAVAAGEYHSLALKSDGTVWAWGSNSSGELGNGTTTDSATPVQVLGLGSALAIGAGSFHALAVVSDTTVWGWGDNFYGQLGDGFSGNIRTLPVHVRDTAGTGNLSGISGLAGGDGFSLAAGSAGSAWGWGYNADGELGLGTTAHHNFPHQVVGIAGVGSLSGVALITAASSHSGSLQSNGTVTTWGSNFGPPNGSSLSPQLVVGLVPVGQPAPCGTPAPPPPPGPTPQSEAGGGSPSTPSASQCEHWGHPVNCATGEIWHRFIDLSIRGRAPALLLSRTYSSTLAGQDGPLGFGWTYSYNMSLSFRSDGSVDVREEGGSIISFSPNGTGGYVAPGWVFATLRRNGDGSYTLTRKNQSSFTFSPFGQLISEQDRNGHPTTLAYTGGQLTAVTDSSGRQLQFHYSGSHLINVTDPTQRAVSFQYDSAGNLVSATDVGGGVTGMTYDVNHLLLTMTDPKGGVVRNQYDASGRVIKQTDALSRTVAWAYGTGTTTITEPKGDAVQEAFKNGRLVSLIKGFGTPQASAWTMTYDQITFGLTSVTDPNGHTTKFTLDSSANILTSTDALSRTWSYTYDSLNDPTSADDPVGTVTRFSYDQRGNITTISQSLNSTTQAVTTASYDPAQSGDVTSVTEPGGGTWSFVYDQFGNAIRTTDPVGDVTASTFDPVSRLTANTTPRGNLAGANPASFTSTYSYNAFDNDLTRTDPLGHTTTYRYDALQNLVGVSDANGHTTTFSYDADNELLTGTRADGGQLQNAYDANGNISMEIDPLGHATSYSYNALDRLVSVTDPLGRSTSYSYDGAGNPTSMTDPLGRITSYTFDPANELTAIAYNDGKTPNVSFAYDSDGRRIQMTDGAGSSSYSYDALSRLVQSIDGSGAKVGYGYDLNGNPTSLAYPDGSQVTRTYDAADRLVTVTDWAGRQTKFGYDADGNLTNQVYPNATTAKFSFDAAEQLSKITDSGPTGQIAFTESRDPVGQLTAENVVGEPPGGPINYGYDATGRLTSANYGGPKLTYQYDKGNRLTQITNTFGTQPVGSAFGYDNADQLQSLTVSQGSSVRKSQFTFDASGNRTMVTDQTGSSTTYTYDQANRLTAYGTKAQYTYNGDGLRMAKTVGGVVEPFTWDIAGGSQLIIQDGTTRYVTGPGGKPLEQVTGAGAVRYYHQDGLGGTRALTDAAGHLDSAYLYDPFGNIITSTQTATPNPFLFAGEYTDAESGFQYLRARYYDSSTAQFLTNDPLASLTRQRYSYGADSPTNVVDPSGLYFYDYRWGLGNWGPGADVRAMSIIQSNPNSVFPFKVEQTSPTRSSNPSIQMKNIYNLVHAYDPLSGNVQVVALTPTSFTFKGLAWNPEGEGGTITFTTYIDKSGNLILWQHAQGPDFDIGPIPLSNAFRRYRNAVSEGKWGQQAFNLLRQMQRAYVPAQLPC